MTRQRVGRRSSSPVQHLHRTATNSSQPRRAQLAPWWPFSKLQPQDEATHLQELLPAERDLWMGTQQRQPKAAAPIPTAIQSSTAQLQELPSPRANPLQPPRHQLLWQGRHSYPPAPRRTPPGCCRSSTAPRRCTPQWRRPTLGRYSSCLRWGRMTRGSNILLSTMHTTGYGCTRAVAVPTLPGATTPGERACSQAKTPLRCA